MADALRMLREDGLPHLAQVLDALLGERVLRAGD